MIALIIFSCIFVHPASVYGSISISYHSTGALSFLTVLVSNRHYKLAKYQVIIFLLGIILFVFSFDYMFSNDVVGSHHCMEITFLGHSMDNSSPYSII